MYRRSTVGKPSLPITKSTCMLAECATPLSTRQRRSRSHARAMLAAWDRQGKVQARDMGMLRAGHRPSSVSDGLKHVVIDSNDARSCTTPRGCESSQDQARRARRASLGQANVITSHRLVSSSVPDDLGPSSRSAELSCQTVDGTCPAVCHALHDTAQATTEGKNAENATSQCSKCYNAIMPNPIAGVCAMSVSFTCS